MFHTKIVSLIYVAVRWNKLQVARKGLLSEYGLTFLFVLGL